MASDCSIGSVDHTASAVSVEGEEDLRLFDDSFSIKFPKERAQIELIFSNNATPSWSTSCGAECEMELSSIAAKSSRNKRKCSRLVSNGSVEVAVECELLNRRFVKREKERRKLSIEC